jgi:hypothetical protein
MLLGRLSRQDRLAIVREVESQIHELLGERNLDELEREDVLDVLRRLDPPEAYLDDETEQVGVAPRSQSQRHRVVAPPNDVGSARVGQVAGILGLVALVFTCVIPAGFVVAELLESAVAFYSLSGGSFFLAIVASILGLTLGIFARRSGAWAIVGIVASMLSIVLSLGCGIVALLVA